MVQKGPKFESWLGEPGSETSSGGDRIPKPALDRAVRKDLATLATFISTYCRHQHKDRSKASVTIKGFCVDEIAGRTTVLCPQCSKLLAHAFVKRVHCPMEPNKPSCKHCPAHCYHPVYRLEIRKAMRFAGRRLLLTGRIDYLLHLIF